MFWLWHKDRLLSYFVQKNSEFTPFSWDRKKYWYQGWIAYLKYFWIICRINWLKGWNNFSKVFFLPYCTIYYILQNISVQLSAMFILGGHFIWRHICCFYQLVTVYSFVTCNNMATWGWGWLPGVPLCLPVRRSLSLSQLINKKIPRSVSFGWNKIIFFWLMAFEIAFPWPLAFFSFLYCGRQQFCENSWYSRHYKIGIWCCLVYCTAFDIVKRELV